MVKRWMNTYAAQMCSMIGVDDETILSQSHAEVVRAMQDDDFREDNFSGTLFDEEIFGKVLTPEERKTKEEPLRMGHIRLDTPLVNIQYFLGQNPVLSKSLGMSIKDLERVVYCSAFTVVDAGSSKLSYKAVLTDNEYRNALETYGDTFRAMTGAEAIEFLLEKEQVSDRKCMVLHNIPVIPSCMRCVYHPVSESPCGKESFMFLRINDMYERVINRNRRLQRLCALPNLPEVIRRNSLRLLQNGVDELISNGSHGIPFFNYRNCEPYESLSDIYEGITFSALPKERSIPESGIDVKLLADAVIRYHEYSEKNIEENKEYHMNGLLPCGT